MGTVKVDNLVNQSGDQDSGLDLATNDQVKVKTANTTRVTVTDATTTVANALAVGGTSNLTITDGDLVIGTSGHGIDFSATSDTSATNASDTSELLDEYEEGTWTPVVADASSGGNTGSYSSGGSAGNRYIKVGRLVYITCELFNINTSGMTAGNVLYIRGLPFSGHSSGTYNVGAVHINDVDYNAGGAYYTFMDNSAFMRVYEVGTTGSGHNSVKIEDLNSGASDIVCTLMYFSS